MATTSCRQSRPRHCGGRSSRNKEELAAKFYLCLRKGIRFGHGHVKIKAQRRLQHDARLQCHRYQNSQLGLSCPGTMPSVSFLFVTSL